MATPRGRAVYKKKEGIITLSDDRAAVIWTPTPGSGPPSVSLPIETITNLQQTPDHVAKVMLKIFAKPPGEAGEPVTYLFNFTSPDDARSEANAIKDLLSKLLAEARTGDAGIAPKASAAPSPAPAAAAANGGGLSGSAAMSFANTVNTGKPRPLDDAQLRLDIALQQSLMKKDRGLHQMYMEARATKPESISDATFNTQFWSSRTSLLRAHAIETSQKRGQYNVLASIKMTPESEGSAKYKLNFTPEQILMVLTQYPLLRRLYNEKVPKELSEVKFWSKFFVSNLARELRGEKLDPNHHDNVFDKYTASDNDKAIFGQFESQQLPHIIDISGNDVNQGGIKGGNLSAHDPNRPDRERGGPAKVLNSLSEMMLAHVSPVDGDRSKAEALSMPEKEYRELALRDLHETAAPDRIVLNVRDQAHFFDQTSGPSRDTREYEAQIPTVVLGDLGADLSELGQGGESGPSRGIDLHAAIGVNDESDSDEDEGRRRKAPRVGSRSARSAAQAQIWRALARSRGDTQGQVEDEASPMGLPVELAQKAFITNATTTEFLKQFWGAFLSGDPDRAQELAYHVEALRNSVSRIEAVAEEAEEMRQRIIAARKQEIMEHYRRTKEKTRFSDNEIKGGKNAVMTLLRSTLGSLKAAQDRYQEALAAEGLKASTE
ncbi:hypothetical protein RB595_004550 [Gaeumannomyces hyphopodioides]